MCQLDIIAKPSSGHELTCETIPISIGGPYVNVWESIHRRDKHQHSSRGGECQVDILAKLTWGHEKKHSKSQ